MKRELDEETVTHLLRVLANCIFPRPTWRTGRYSRSRRSTATSESSAVDGPSPSFGSSSPLCPGFVVMRVDFNSVGGEVGSDKSSGEDVLESLFPLKSRCNKRPGVSLEFSPQLSSSSSTRDAHRCNVEAKRFKKSTFSNNVWAEGAWNRTMDQVSNPVDDSAFDMSDAAIALSEVSSTNNKELSEGCPSFSSIVNDASSLLRSAVQVEAQHRKSSEQKMAVPNNSNLIRNISSQLIASSHQFAQPADKHNTLNESSCSLGCTVIPTAPNFARPFYEDSRSAIRWDFSCNIVCPRLYANDIYVTMRELERGIGLKKKFLTRQREINEADRARVVDWMSHYHTFYHLKLETLHLAVAVLDRLLCIVKFPRSKAEQIAAVALMLASKVEDLVPLKIANLVENVISYEVDKRAVMHIEQSALYHLNYRIQMPTAYNFANYFNMMVESDAVQIEMVNFLLELALRVASFAENPPSEVALSALLVARAILRRDCSRRWLCARIPHCRIRFEDVESNMSLLFCVFKRGSTFAPNICKEYSKREHFGVAALRFAVMGL
uniref:Cyclin-B1-2 n=1 Tax=Ascaris suum TaxID=6253 RepID=F1KZ44_ASCSU